MYWRIFMVRMFLEYDFPSPFTNAFRGPVATVQKSWLALARAFRGSPWQAVERAGHRSAGAWHQLRGRNPGGPGQAEENSCPNPDQPRWCNPFYSNHAFRIAQGTIKTRLFFMNCLCSKRFKHANKPAFVRLYTIPIWHDRISKKATAL